MKMLATSMALAGAFLALTAAGGSAATNSPGAAARANDVPPIAYGVADDVPKYSADGGAWFYGQMQGAGLTEDRWALTWDPSNPTAITELPFLQRAAPEAQAAGIHIVLALYSSKASAYNVDQFCAWTANVAQTVKQWGITDLIVGNEPNIRTFLTPQKNGAGKDVAAPVYEALLARCYDAIKQANPDARVIGMGLSPHATNKKSNHPLSFLRDVGKAYRASGRTTPIMDQLAIHPYPNPHSPTDPPGVGYGNPDDFGIPNLDRVKQAVYDAFNGTAQPTTLNGLTFRIDEVGWQVETSGLPQYFGAENVKTVTPQQQASDIKTMIGAYFACDPTVTDVLLFHLEDEKYRGSKDENGNTIGGGWQSGLITYGGPGVSQPRPAYGLMAQEAAAGRNACTTGTVSWKPGQTTTVRGKLKRKAKHKRKPKPKPKRQ